MDQQIVLNQSEAWKALFGWLGNRKFELSIEKACEHPAINLPAKRHLEFNRLMLVFYDTGKQQPMNIFLRTCLDERLVEIMREEAN